LTVGRGSFSPPAVAGVRYGALGELRTVRLPAAHEPLMEWLLGLRAPVRVAYERLDLHL
jgi:hypothetical protein